MTQNTKIEPELSRPFNMGDVSEKQPVEKSLTATPEELKDLAKRFEILSMEKLEADLTIRKTMGGRMVRIDGHLSADVTQECIVTLEPVKDHLDTKFQAFFTDIKPPKMTAAEIEFKNERESPEYAPNGRINLGEVVAQFAALELDPYPRKDGVHHDVTDEEQEGAETTPNPDTHRPFEVLKDMDISKD